MHAKVKAFRIFMEFIITADQQSAIEQAEAFVIETHYDKTVALFNVGFDNCLNFDGVKSLRIALSKNQLTIPINNLICYT